MGAQAFLLAAGFGTRLRPLTLHRPKPLVPICGIPMLDYAAALVFRHGISEAVVNAHHQAEQIERWADAHIGLRLKVSVEEPVILGTGGGLRRAEAWLDERFVVVNGDILSDVDLTALMGLLDDGDAAMALRHLQTGDSYGEVLADTSGTVVSLVQLAEAQAEGRVIPNTHFTGVHAMGTAALHRVPPGGESCVVRTAYTGMVPERRVRALLHTGSWFDVGTPAAYLRANFQALSGRLALPINPHSRAGWIPRGPDEGAPDNVTVHRQAHLLGDAWIGRGVRIDSGAHIGRQVVLGEGAVIERGAHLERTVVWDGCTVPAHATLNNAVVYDGGVLEVA